MLWAYFSFSQFLIIWAGNLPEEIPYYLERLHGGWKYLSLVLVIGHFGLPFCLLLSADLKKRPNLLARVAWFIVAIRLYDVIWLVAPGFNQGAFPISSRTSGSRWRSPARGSSCSPDSCASTRCCRSTTRTSSRCWRSRTRGGTEMSSHHPHGPTDNPGRRSRGERHQCPRDHLVRGRAHRRSRWRSTSRCGGCSRGSRTTRRRTMPSVTPLAAAPAPPTGGPMPAPGLQLTPWTDLKAFQRGAGGAPPRLRLGRRARRRRARADREGEGAAAEAGPPRASGARRRARRHQPRLRRRIERRTDDSRRAAPTSRAAGGAGCARGAGRADQHQAACDRRRRASQGADSDPTRRLRHGRFSEPPCARALVALALLRAVPALRAVRRRPEAIRAGPRQARARSARSASTRRSGSSCRSTWCSATKTART